ncbi:hypothetical protein Tco_0846919 [Tanacetum coccineum]
MKLRHKQVLKTKNPSKRIALLENEHSKSFAKWLREEVERELAISKDSVSETVSNDDIVYQNSRVSVEAVDLHISKEVVTTRKAFYYGVLQEIWVLDYHFRQIPSFKCDWVNHKASGVKHDPNLGYTLVDLNSLGHKDDPFILASQAQQVFYVKDQIDKKLSIVFRTPTKNYNDTYDEVDKEFSTVIHEHNDNILPRVNRRDLGNESQNDYYRKDRGGVAIVSAAGMAAVRFWGSKLGCNESDVKPSWKDIKKAKACMLAKAQASEEFLGKVDASDAIKGKTFGVRYKDFCEEKDREEGSLEVDKIIDISSDSSDDRRWASKKASAPVFYGPSTQGLLDAYGCDTIKECLEWNYFPSTA